MNAPLDAIPWSGRRWAITVGLLFIGQILLLIYSGRRDEPSPAQDPFPIRVLWAADLYQAAAQLPGLKDPMLFALAHPQGFSGEAWLTYSPMDHQPRSWTEPPRWLKIEETALSRPLAGHLPTNPPPALAPIRSRPRLNDWPVYLAPAPKFTQSTLQLTGEVSAADLLTAPTLPSWPSRDIVGRSRLGLLIQPNGSVFSAVLLDGCGLADADRRALELARQLQFNTMPEVADTGLDLSLRSAEAVFGWHTVEEPAGQRAPGPAQP